MKNGNVQDTDIRAHGAGTALLSRRPAEDGLEETEGMDRLLSAPERETVVAGQDHLHPHVFTAASEGDRGSAGRTIGSPPRPSQREGAKESLPQPSQKEGVKESLPRPSQKEGVKESLPRPSHKEGVKESLPRPSQKEGVVDR